jgi:hypothetical protein
MSTKVDIDVVDTREYTYAIGESLKYAFFGFIGAAVAAVVLLIIMLVIGSAFENTPSPYKNFQKAISMGATVEVNVLFGYSQRYLVPNITGNLGRAYITITGGGGGGCAGGVYAGGGGNSGASGVRVPIVIHNADICQVTIGGGGNPNTDGALTSFVCYPSTGSIATVNFTFLGGRSGCFNNTDAVRNGDNNYPFIAELFGARPNVNPVAESNMYGGIGGVGVGGGAGSIFGNGGNTGALDTNGHKAIGYGAGGGGGGALSGGGSTTGGVGGSGFVQLNFYVAVHT